MVTGAAGTLLGPLTTAWSIPDSCRIHVMNCLTCAEAFQGQQCVMDGKTGRAEDHTTCWPPVTSRAGTPGYPFMGWGYYSPGLACPTGYTAACTAEYGRRPEWEIQFTLIPGETAVGCCPEGYGCANFNGNTCTAVTSTGQLTVTTAMCTGTRLGNIREAAFPDLIVTTDESGSIETVTHAVRLMAPMFQLNYQASDLVSASASVTSQQPSQQPSQTITPAATASMVIDASTATSATSTGSVPSSAASGQGGLSTGATIGLGVGAALGGILLAAVVVGVWLCLRKRARATTVEAGPVLNGHVAPHPPHPPQQWDTSKTPAYTHWRQDPLPVEMPAPVSHDHWQYSEGRQRGYH